MAITQVITPLPAAPDPATDTRDQFSTKAAASVLAQKAMVPELNAWAEQVNAIAAAAVGDVATAIGAASADTPVGTDEIAWRKTATGILKKVTFTNALAWFAAVAGSASQAFSVAAATAAAHAVRFDQTSLSCAFIAYRSAPAYDVTGDGTSYKIIFDTELVDRGSNYNPTTAVFTAPVTGLYRLTARALIVDLAAAHNSHVLSISTSNRDYNQNDAFPAASNPFVTQRELAVSVLADMDIGDTAIVNLSVGGSTKVVDVYGGAGSGYTMFCGESV
jgi:hypothetical protein